MANREALIEALKNAPDEYGVIKMSTEIRDIIVKELEARPERIILRLTNWVKLTHETFEKLKNTVMAQLENGDKVIIIPNVCEAVYIPDGLEVKFLP